MPKATAYLWIREFINYKPVCRVGRFGLRRASTRSTRGSARTSPLHGDLCADPGSIP